MSKKVRTQHVPVWERICDIPAYAGVILSLTAQ